ncbi:hypothetical protein RF679_05525 [Undibacterium cyanobacteriorum]|uniref:SGNH/GDSL hydrolase family protein n=1 Tax=Undibacterium cyanobacteriorum TaxID=3073561 RepID=A0ABY9RLP0_9BURK|nr:hypothetical protein [Undibacterium sp. 20NA77.5]WMW81739.1 hypothetical protein RF679_05525 [Undibacterium sp. 20NA77.5]
MKLLKNLLLSAVTVIVLLILIELALHLANFPATPKAGWRWDESPYRAVINKDDHQVNQLGLRGRTIHYADDDYVIALVGDSQVEAGTQAADQLPEIKLERALRSMWGTEHVKVFSIASAGWGQDQQLLALQDYFQKFRANAVVVWTTPVNDYWENTFIDRSVTEEAGKLKPTFAIAGTQLKTMMPPRFEFKLRNLMALALSPKVKDQKISIEQVYLNRWVRGLPSKQRAASDPKNCPTTEVKESELIEAFVQGQRAYTLLVEEDVDNGRSHFTPFLQHLSPREEYAVQISHRLFEELQNVSKSHGANFHIYHPYRDDLDAAFREIKCVKNTKHNTYFAYDGSDWLRFLKNSSLAPTLLSPQVNSDHALNVSKGDWHFGDEGNTLAMQALAQLLPKPSTLSK